MPDGMSGTVSTPLAADVVASGGGGARPAPLQLGYADVWSYTQPKYRARAIVLLAIDLLLFCGLCVFSHWLHVARPFDFSIHSYFSPARFWGQGSPNLNDFILYPISVEHTPVHAIVLGLLVASIVSVPITISILYRFPSAIPFLLAVLIFAHMPWMALTLTGSCVLASLRPFRLNFRYASCLLAMLPVLLYLLLATRGGADRLGAASPSQSAVLAAPWVLAILAACAMMGVILTIARLSRYRPGAIAPVLACMFATPVVLFHVRVGADELAFRVLESEYGPDALRFAPVQEAESSMRRVIPRLLGDDVFYSRHRADLLGLLRGEFQPVRDLLWRHVLSELLADRASAYEACKKFTFDYPSSRHVPEVLFIQARVLDTRLDERRLADLRRETYTDFAHVQSEEPWLKLATQYPQSPLAVAANLRIAELRLRRGEVDAAQRALELALEHPAAQGAAWRSATASGFDAAPYVLEARRLRELIAANRDDPVYLAEPLRELAALDRRRAQYREQLCRLAQRYPDALLYDNIVTRWAASLEDPARRAAALEACAQSLRGDALPEALLLLGEIEAFTLGRDDAARRSAGAGRLRRVASEFSSTVWGDLAAARLEELDPAVARAEGGS